MDPYDHRSLGNRLDLFHQQEEAPGQAFWHPRGFAVFRAVEDVVRRRLRRAGFAEVRTPQLLAFELWHRSGHAEKFAEDMFCLDDDGRPFALKPMSCPGHIQLFRSDVRSWRDLPVRYCEFGMVHRNEPSGALHGLMRVRAFEQDDAHIFCTPDQVAGEIARFWRLVQDIYGLFGFRDLSVGLSTRPAVRAGDDAVWDEAEGLLAQAATAAGMAFSIKEGEGAFYGPKLEIGLTDGRGRVWQCGTIQLDLILPDRLDAAYVARDGARRRPVLLHQAILGSIERFVGILLEHFDGRLPFWLAPDQVAVATIGDGVEDYAETVAGALREADIRVTVDAGPDRLSRKIVSLREACVPVLLAVGFREANSLTVSLRRPDGASTVLPLAEAVGLLAQEAALPN